MSYEPAPCPDGVALARALGEGAEPGMRAHLDSCPHCRAERAAIEQVRELGRHIPVPSLTAAAHDELRAALTARAAVARAAAPAARARFGLWLLAPLGAAVAAGTLLLVYERAPVPVPAAATAPAPIASSIHRAKLSARSGTVLSRHGAQPDEIVRLREGTVAVEVTRLQPGERFRVVTGDGEVEVRGTAFEVTAADDRLDHVRVLHGQVEVRPAGRPAVLLGAGDDWNTGIARVGASAPVPGLPRSRGVARSARAGRVVAASPAPPEQPASPPGSESERHFRAGWAALRSGDAALAVQAFEDGQRSPGAAVLQEDLDFWRAVALGRAGRAADARASLQAFLDRRANSPRAGEAAAMLGWLLLDAGDVDGAAARFATAAADRAPQARRSGLDGLRAVARRR